MKIPCFTTFLSAFTVATVSGFQTIPTPVSISSRTTTLRNNKTLLFSEKEDDVSKGMEDAFRQLENIVGGDDSFSVPEQKDQQDEAFAKAMQGLDLKGMEDIPSTTPEAEVALYSEMASEIDGASELDLIDDVKTALGGSKTAIPKFDPNVRDTEKFMEKALDEAIEEARKNGEANIDKESLLDNKEIMKEIEAIFDRANDQLLEGLEDIRKEQIELAASSAMRTSKESEAKIREDEERLAAAESNMKKMLAKVNVETKNVEQAIEDLRTAQEESESGVDNQLLDLKSGGLVKQATLVGTLLFSLRSVVDGIAFLSGDPSHLLPAIIQGGIALVCLAVFIFGSKKSE